MNNIVNHNQGLFTHPPIYPVAQRSWIASPQPFERSHS